MGLSQFRGGNIFHHRALAFFIGPGYLDRHSFNGGIIFFLFFRRSFRDDQGMGQESYIGRGNEFRLPAQGGQGCLALCRQGFLAFLDSDEFGLDLRVTGFNLIGQVNPSLGQFRFLVIITPPSCRLRPAPAATSSW